MAKRYTSYSIRPRRPVLFESRRRVGTRLIRRLFAELRKQGFTEFRTPRMLSGAALHAEVRDGALVLSQYHIVTDRWVMRVDIEAR